MGPTETMSISVSAKISIVSVEKNGKFMYHRTSASFHSLSVHIKLLQMRMALNSYIMNIFDV